MLGVKLSKSPGPDGFASDYDLAVCWGILASSWHHARDHVPGFQSHRLLYGGRKRKGFLLLSSCELIANNMTAMNPNWISLYCDSTVDYHPILLLAYLLQLECPEYRHPYNCASNERCCASLGLSQSLTAAWDFCQQKMLPYPSRQTMVCGK